MTVPQPRRELSPAQREQYRRRQRVNQQRHRARLAGKTVTAEDTARMSVRLAAPPAAWSLPAEPACTGADPGLFFSPEQESPQARDQREAKARAYCVSCPVRAQCLATARERGERFGIWGGTDLETERKQRSPQAARPGAATPDRAGPG
jgi:WhiB family redox-sensing transcriptional regulator